MCIYIYIYYIICIYHILYAIYHLYPFISIYIHAYHTNPYTIYSIYHTIHTYIYIYLEPPSTEILVSDPDFNTISKRNQKNQKPNLNRFDMTPSLRCLSACWRCFFVRPRCVSRCFRFRARRKQTVLKEVYIVHPTS